MTALRCAACASPVAPPHLTVTCDGNPLPACSPACAGQILRRYPLEVLSIQVGSPEDDVHGRMLMACHLANVLERGGEIGPRGPEE